jgi:hypothetical protein
VTRTPPLPDLDTLNSAEKDALIVSLWQTINAMEGSSASSQPAVSEIADLRSRISRASASRRFSEKARSGLRHALFQSRFALGLLVAIGVGFGGDLAIGAYQEQALALRQQAARALENAAFAGLYVELADVAYEPDGKSYGARLTLQNANPAEPLYIMLDPPRVFVQTGLIWQGVSTEAGSSARVVKLVGPQEIRLVFQADIDNWMELMPGYMHVRIESPMLISRRSEPEDDIVERANRFYVYLKPHGSDDAAIKQRMNFSGIPPIFIPMPPH